ncbi:MAG: SUMF1/EgtB/PvdO family nonheme iron enzyme [Planctomycetota bacterium]|jgi:formylglycine-generating enzyme required for sulfatase activity/type II secretory pathway predicted ATPase ExeA
MSNIEKALSKSNKEIKKPDLVMSETHKTNFFLSLYDTNKSNGCDVVTGAINKRQTTICRMVLKRSNMENYNEPLLDHSNLEDNRLESILQNLVILGKCSDEHTKKEQIYQLITFLLNAMTDGESALLVIDDTQNILLSLMEQTKILSRMEAEKEKRLQVVLLGRKNRIQSLHSLQLKQAYQRISVRQPPDKLKVEEIRKNIENRLTMDGSTDEICFSAEALTFIRNNSLGISCMANLMHDNVHLSLHNKKAIKIEEEIVENTVENLKFTKKEIEAEGEKKQSVKVETEKNPLFKSESLKIIYLIGFGILAIIIVEGVIINLSSRKRSVKEDLEPIYTLTAQLYTENSFPALQDIFKITRDAFDSEIEFRKHQQEAVNTFNNIVEQHNPDYQAATATLSIEGYNSKSGKLPLSINWKCLTKQLDREGYIVVPGDKAKALLKEGKQKPIYVYLDIIENALTISKIGMIGLKEEMVVSFWPDGTVKYDPLSDMKFVWIRGRSFTMGSSNTDGDSQGSEKPAHEVFINGFWMGKYEVTQAQWEQIMGQNDLKSNSEQSAQVTSKYPVMTFNEEFLVKLNESAEGDIYRLPSEAEWEYAAMAGSSGKYCFGDDTNKLEEYAWYSKNSGGTIHPVGQLKPNRWGLYDMHGNVSELCEDAWHPNYDNAPIDGSVWNGGHESKKVVRGGGIEDPPVFLRSRSRGVSDSGNDHQSGGFRLIRSGGFLD